MKTPNQKLKLLYLQKYLLDNTDEEHTVTAAQMIEELAKHDISVDRKTLYNDLEALRDFGMDILKESVGKHTTYHVASRDFEDVELKLLVDSVQTSNFITHKKTEELIKKVGSLTSVHKKKELNRQVYVRNRIKNMDESVYYNVDVISRAILEDKQIRFKYYDYDMKKQRFLRHNGEYYKTSPFVLIWVDQNYYLLSVGQTEDEIRHFRVDRMTGIEMLEEDRTGKNVIKEADISTYTTKVFYMFTGKEETVSVKFDQSLMGTVIDRFGKDVPIYKEGETHFIATLHVVVSQQFYAWLFAFGDKAEIIEPDHVRNGMVLQAQSVLAQYK